MDGPWASHDVRANGILQRVDECGSGPLVVLLHGFPLGRWAWHGLLPALAAAGWRAVAVDLRGYGDTDKTPRGYDPWTLAGDVDGLVRALGERRATLVGHGTGGLLAWAVAALHPRTVTALAVLGAPHPLDLLRALRRDPAQRRAVRAAAVAQLPRLPEHLLTRDGGALVERLLWGWGGPAWPSTPAFRDAADRARAAVLRPAAAHCALEHHRWQARSLLRPDGRRFRRALAAPVQVPVLRVRGALDPLVRPATSGAPVVLPDVGHLVPLEAPRETADLLRGFLDRAR